MRPSKNQLGTNFATSAEFLARYGNTTDGQFVDLLYNNVLGRTADDGGRAVQVSFIDGALDGIRHGRGELLANFADRAEFVGKTQLQIAGALSALHETAWGGV